MPFNTSVLDAFFSTSKKISSNVEKGSVLRKVSSSDKLTKGAVLQVLESSRSMTSNVERANVMRSVSKTSFITDKEVKSKYLEVAKSLTSDSLYREVMEYIMD